MNGLLGVGNRLQLRLVLTEHSSQTHTDLTILLNHTCLVAMCLIALIWFFSQSGGSQFNTCTTAAEGSSLHEAGGLLREVNSIHVPLPIDGRPIQADSPRQHATCMHYPYRVH
jgi:hypothetical protein